MKIYLSSRFRTLPSVLALKGKLVAAGHQVVSTWHDNEAKNPVPLDSPEYAAAAQASARRDRREIAESDLFVILTQGCEQTPGGLWFEMGFAYSHACYVIVFGPKINIFCHLTDDMEQVETEESLIAAIEKQAKDIAALERAFEEARRVA